MIIANSLHQNLPCASLELCSRTMSQFMFLSKLEMTFVKGHSKIKIGFEGIVPEQTCTFALQ